jgi:hypothetical protein
VQSKSNGSTLLGEPGAGTRHAGEEIQKGEDASMGAGSPIAGAFARTMRTAPNQMANELQGLLSRRLVAYMIGAKDPKTISRWANDESVEIRDPAMLRRLQAIYQIAVLLLEYEGARTVKSWFIGMNPILENLSPVEVIHGGREAEAMDAAQEFVAQG